MLCTRCVFCLHSLYMQQCVVWLLTFMAMMERLALLHIMTWSQAIHAYRMLFQCCDHLIMRQALKLGAHIERMFVILTQHTIGNSGRSVTKK